jgi:putative ABC transport system permease protein
MLRNVLAATLRNLMRNRLHAAISIGGLAIGMAAAILTGLYIRGELSFDSFMPGHDKAYVVVWELDQPGAPPIVEDWSQYFVARAMKLDFKEVQAAARLNLGSQPVGVRSDRVEGLESIGWSDPDLFSILRAPALAGDPVATLHRPDGVVITRAMARKYFGQDAPIGRVLTLNRQAPLRVGAVIDDPPPTSDLMFQIFASALNAASPLRQDDLQTNTRGTFWVTSRSYVRLADAAAAARLNAAMPDFFRRHLANPDGSTVLGLKGSFKLIPVGDLHLYPLKNTSLVNGEGLGSRSALVALAVIAVLVLCAASVNFINLMTGRAARRAVEVGVRKAAGASRGHLVLQFMGEALLYAIVALVLALALAELVRPLASGLVGRELSVDFWRDPQALGGCLALAVGLGLLTGVYPALIQSSFRPAAVLKGVLPQATGSAAIRSVLTTLQFAVLIGLILAIIVIARQTRYALNQAFDVDKSMMLTVDITPGRLAGGPPRQPEPLCRDTFPDRVRALPGVAAAACSGSGALEVGDNNWDVETPTGPKAMDIGAIDHGFFELYGVKPLAGRLFSQAHPEDEAPTKPPYLPKTIVINESAARALGYSQPALAIGKFMRPQGQGQGPIQIIGVVPDVTFDLKHPGAHPATYLDSTLRLDTLTVKLAGRDVPGTLRAIDAAWRATGSARPPRRRFVDDYLQQTYLATIQQGRLLDVLCGVAVLLAGLGLFGLASFTAERRVKEIGVRKAMGASTADVARLLLWSFSQPVLWANLIAWPLAWWALRLWLEGFSRHISLQPWMFLVSAAAALLIALATVFAHTLRVASAKPVGALRYE